MPDKTESQPVTDDGDSRIGSRELKTVELSDGFGTSEEFVILEEIDFEERHFVVMAPYFEIKSLKESVEESDEIDLSIEIYEVKENDDYDILDDDHLMNRLMQHLKEQSREPKK